MTALPRRRADAFDAWLQTTAADPSPGAGTAGPDPRWEAEFGALRPALLALREHESPDPRPEFVDALRGTLLERARVELVPARSSAPGRTVRPVGPSRSPRRAGRDRWIAAAVAALALTGAAGASAVASQGSLPGDTLYPLKRVIEDAQVGLQGGDLDRGRALLAHAGDRLAELDRLDAAGVTDVGLVRSTLSDFAEQTDDATSSLLGSYATDPRPETVAALRTFAARSTDDLGRLRAALPVGAADAIDDALVTVARVDARALDACATCSALPALPLITPAAADTDPGAGSVDPAEPATPSPGAQTDSPGAVPGRNEDPRSGRDDRRSTAGEGRSPRSSRPGAPTSTPGSPGTVGGEGGGVTSQTDDGGLVGDTLRGVGGAVDGLAGSGSSGGSGGSNAGSDPKGSGSGSGQDGDTQKSGKSSKTGKAGGGSGVVDGLVDDLDGAVDGLGGSLGG